MSVLGADVEQLGRLADECARTASSLSGTAQSIDGTLAMTWWEGDAAAGFRRQWRGVHGPAVRDVADRVADVGRVARRAAADQLLASAAALVGSALAAAVSSAAGGPNAETLSWQSSDGGSDLAPPPSGGDPVAVNDWWVSLPEDVQQRYIAEYPELIGQLEGIDVADRDTANRVVAERAVDELEAENQSLAEENRRLGEKNQELMDQNVYPAAAPEAGAGVELELSSGSNDDGIARNQEQIDENNRRMAENSEQIGYFEWLLGAPDAEASSLVPVGDDGQPLPAPVLILRLDPGDLWATQVTMPGDLPPPPNFLDPAETEMWWASLSEEDRDRYVAEYPELIGQFDGIDAESRDQANRILVQQEIDRIEAENAALEEENAALDENGLDPLRSDRDANDLQIAENNDQIAFYRWLLGEPGDTVSTQTPLGDDGQPLPPPDNILLFEPNGANHDRLVVAYGAVETAETVTVFVPGMTADENVRSSLENTYELQEIAEGDSGEGGYATVMWLDYDAPNDLGEAWDGLGKDLDGSEADGPGEKGAPNLTNFLTGLEATNPGARKNLIGHSYGTVVVAIAADESVLPIDRLALVASPGVPEEPSDWQTQVEVVVFLNDDDRIAQAPRGGGVDPEEWGGVQIRGDGDHGMSDYLDPDVDQDEDTRTRFVWFIRGEDMDQPWPEPVGSDGFVPSPRHSPHDDAW